MSSVLSAKPKSFTRDAVSSVSVRSKSAGTVKTNVKTDKPPRPASKKATKSSSDKLRAKEEEYRRINAEIEAKTSELVKEAEELLKGDLSALMEDTSPRPHSPHSYNDAHSPFHTSHSPRELLSNLLNEDNLASNTSASVKSKSQQRPSTVSMATAQSQSSIPTRPHSSTQRRPHSKPTGPSQSRSKTSLSAQGHPHSKPRSSKPLPQTTSIRPDIESAMERLELEGNSTLSDDDIIPQVAEGMGAEATVRFLKAKLRVMQEEMDRLLQENREKEKCLQETEKQFKEVSEAAGKAQRGHAALVGQVDKFRALSETHKHKSNGLETQLVALRKELDGLKGSQRKAASTQSSVEVRLNRALEEVEKYKAALHKARADSKDSSKADRQRLDQLTADNKQLERQKTELIAGFKKQMKLIDVLKRQKMHIEAAKILSFTEEEFVKTLDWGSS